MLLNFSLQLYGRRVVCVCGGGVNQLFFYSWLWSVQWRWTSHRSLCKQTGSATQTCISTCTLCEWSRRCVGGALLVTNHLCCRWKRAELFTFTGGVVQQDTDLPGSGCFKQSMKQSFDKLGKGCAAVQKQSGYLFIWMWCMFQFLPCNLFIHCMFVSPCLVKRESAVFIYVDLMHSSL